MYNVSNLGFLFSVTGWLDGAEERSFHFISSASRLRRPEADQFLPVISLMAVPGCFCLILNARVFSLGEFLPPDIPFVLCRMQFEVPLLVFFSLQAGSLGWIRGKIWRRSCHSPPPRKFRRIRTSEAARRLVVLYGTNCHSWGCAYFSNRLSSIRSYSPWQVLPFRALVFSLFYSYACTSQLHLCGRSSLIV